MKTNVIDTNVLIVANNKPTLSPQASNSCVLACIDVLTKIRLERVSIDDQFSILTEYKRYMDHKGQPGVGDAFFKWLWDHLGTNKVEQVKISPTGDEHILFQEISQSLKGFDRSDQDFLAIAIGSIYNATIHNAVDSDWKEFEAEILAIGIAINFVC